MGVATVVSYVVVFLLTTTFAFAAPFQPPSLVAHWGHRGTDPSSFFAVMAIAVDPDGSVYSADSQGRIDRFSVDGEFALQWGSRGSADGQLQTPTGIAVSPSGEVYVVEFGGNRVQVFDRTGRYLRKWGAKGSGSGQFDGPEKIALDRHGDVYVTDTGNCRIQKFSPSGRFKVAWGRRGTGPGEFALPVGIAASPDDRILVADLTAGGIQVFDTNGRYLSRWDPGPDTEPPPNWIPSLKGGKQGGVTSWMAEVPELTGDLRKALCDSSLHKPAGIAIDSAGVVYVVNQTCDRVQEYGPDGRFLGGWWVSGVPTHAMGQMTDIAVGRGGDVYVAEMNGPRIRKFGYGPVRSDRIVAESLGANRLRMLDSLINLPFGEQSPRSTPVALGTMRLRWEYLGFSQHPMLAEAVSVLDIPESPKAGSIRAAYADAVGRRVGAPPAPVDAAPVDSATYEGACGITRYSSLQLAGGGYRIRIERESSNAHMAAMNRNSCDLRLIEGGTTEASGHWEPIVRGLRSLWPDLAGELVSGRVTKDSLLSALLRATPPNVSQADRDLLLLTADQWLRVSGTSGYGIALRHDLGQEWVQLGFRAHRVEGAYWSYCGSVLDSLAARVGQDEWADRAFLALLDQGWVTDCSGQFEGAAFGNDLFTPVLRRGEAFLSSHPGAAVWPSVALRVALAHETLWSLSHRRDPGDDPDLKAEAPTHRRRALDLYRDLVTRTRDAGLQRAIENRIRSLEQDVNTKCSVYYIEGED